MIWLNDKFEIERDGHIKQWEGITMHIDMPRSFCGEREISQLGFREYGLESGIPYIRRSAFSSAGLH
jgi:hypothetical protein